MPSPFPGMNPYLEQEEAWHDFHQSFIPAAREALHAQLPPDYIVKVEYHLYIHELPAEERRLLGRADVALAHPPGGAAAAGASAVLAAPAYATVPPAVDVVKDVYLAVYDRDRREVVTVLELLSPSNKDNGSDREQYLGKRKQVFASNTHLVEIDLLRGGPRLPLDGLPHCDYYVLVSRSQDRPRVGVWPIALRERLPVIPIPLRVGDVELQLDLQNVLNRVYDAAGYARYVYKGLPKPPFTPADAAWAQQFIPAAV